MQWLADPTRRFPYRPWYERAELDDLCQEIVVEFLTARHGSADYPISTADLTVLVEQHTSDLDSAADLSDEGDEVEGVTKFLTDQAPVVQIDQRLTMSRAEWAETRFRSTLMHELGHVVLHGQLVPRGQLPLFGDHGSPRFCRCTQDCILQPAPVDWLEWQAAYASGAFLMPIEPLRNLVTRVRQEWRVNGPIQDGHRSAQDLIRQTQRRFLVSPSAARVRLLQEGLLMERTAARVLA